MQHELELAYIGVEVADPASMNGFLADAIGLVPGEPADSDTATWRNDGAAHRIIVQPGAADDASFVGLEAADGGAFEAVIDRLRSRGFEVAEGDADSRRVRRVDRLARTVAPWGVPLEIVVGLESATAPYESPLMPGGFLTDDVGFGHVVFATTEFDASHRFLTEGLGFVRSDWLDTEIAEGITLEVQFFHCNERHHSIALARAPFELPQKLHHFMLETNERDDVGAAFDRVWDSGLPIPNGLGRHDNDGMFSFYVASPAGFQVEVGHGAKLVTDDWDGDRRYDQISAWGHQPLRQ